MSLAKYGTKVLFKKRKPNIRREHPDRTYVVQFHKTINKFGGARNVQVEICTRGKGTFIFTDGIHDGYEFRNSSFHIKDEDVISYVRIG